jgi:hypothetical protein
MTTAGTATVALSPEASFNGSLSDVADWFQPGVDISVTGPSIERNQEAKRQPDETTPAAHRPGQLNVSATIEFAMAGDTQRWEDAVFHGGGSNNDLPQTGGKAPSYHVFFSSQFLDGTDTSITATGGIATSAEVSFDDGGDATVSLTMEFAEVDDTATTPSSGDITQPSADAVYPYHSLSLDVGTVTQTDLNSASFSVNSLHRLRYGLDQVAQAGVVDAIEPEASTDATYTEEDQLTLATTGTTGGSLVNTADLVFALTNTNGTTQTYTVAGARPDSFEWSSLVDPGDDLAESVTFNAQTITTS